MYTVAESDDFVEQAKAVWTDDEKSEFISF